jgi:hypothetical protein
MQKKGKCFFDGCPRIEENNWVVTDLLPPVGTAVRNCP